jgi:hypothetical protein
LLLPSLHAVKHNCLSVPNYPPACAQQQPQPLQPRTCAKQRMCLLRQVRWQLNCALDVYLYVVDLL